MCRKILVTCAWYNKSRNLEIGMVWGKGSRLPWGILLFGISLKGAEERAEEAVCWHNFSLDCFRYNDFFMHGRGA